MRIVLLLLALLLGQQVLAQDPESLMERQMEDAAVTTETEQEDDQWQQELQQLLISPLPVNFLEASALKELRFLTDLQIDAFLLYRSRFGPIRNKYELQAIPYWDIATIRKILPLLSFREDRGGEKQVRTLLTKGNHQLLMRMGAYVQTSKGFQKDSLGHRAFAGSPARIFYRYTYQYQQQVWWGLTGDKDPGEKPGDFTGFHFFLRRPGFLKTIALGDYVVNIGQGLTHWQGLALGKTSEAMNLYQQGNLLQPYRSGGEWNFHRGLALQFQRRHLEATIFGSRRKISANLVTNAAGEKGFSSIDQTGYHRTAGELEDRNSVRELVYGSVLQYITNRFLAGASFTNYQFSLPAMPVDQPYNLFAIRGRNWQNAELHYSFSIRNIFLFGQWAWSPGGMAIIQGMILPVYHKADLSILHRSVQPGYQALYAQAFMENSRVNNESGTYIGLKIQLHPNLQLQTYIDVFRFPWLRFRTAAPSSGSEFNAQLNWVLRKRWMAYLRFHQGNKPENETADPMPFTVNRQSSGIRLHGEKIWSANWTSSVRLDGAWWSKEQQKERGWSVYADNRYRFAQFPLSVAARVHYFHTDGYNSRIYAYERDVLYAFSIPAFYDKGWRYYLQLQGKPNRRSIGRLHYQWQWWIRWAQTIYGSGHEIGSGQDAVRGNQRSDWKVQFILSW